MASIIDFTLDRLYAVSVRFPQGSASELLARRLPGLPNLLDAADVPPIAYLHSSHKAIPDFIPINAMLAVCSEARDLIEALEPGRHQFFPVEIKRLKATTPIRRANGRELQLPFLLINPVRLDAVCVEKSAVKVTSYANFPDVVVPVTPGQKDQVVLRRKIIEGHHVWRGAYQMGNYTFFSDQLTKAVTDAKWKGLRFTKIEED